MSRLQTLRRLAVKGPEDGDGLAGWTVGMLVWWRIWFTIALYTVPVYAGFAGLTYTNPAGAVMITWLAAMLTTPFAMRINPKYRITEVY